MLEWIEKLSKKKQFDVMEECFFNDLEKWFDASTFYCESCVDEFIKYWPGIYNRDLDFQTNMISLDTLYDGGRLKDYFSKEEFIDLSQNIVCKNCSNNISDYIYPYELRFEIPEDFYSDIEEIASIANRTPFLLMNHKFSKKVYDQIKYLSNNIRFSRLDSPLYRARVDIKKDTYSNSDFFAPPKEVIKEGRYNHAGKQVLYLAEDELTCYSEMRKPNVGIMMAEIKIDEQLKILDLDSQELSDNDLMQAIQYSSLLSSPRDGEGWDKPHYIFTRFISDVALSLGFDAIRYPSVRMNTGYNIVIINYEKFQESINVVSIEHVDEGIMKSAEAKKYVR